MAKQEREVKAWITVNGHHVPVFEGETAKDAVGRLKFGNKSKTAVTDRRDRTPVADERSVKVTKKAKETSATRKDAGELPAHQKKFLSNRTPEELEWIKKQTEKNMAISDNIMAKHPEKTKEMESYKAEATKLLSGIKKEQEVRSTSATNKGEEKVDLSVKGRDNLKGQPAPKDLPRVTDEQAKANEEVQYNGVTYQTQALHDVNGVAGHLYIPNQLDKTSFFVAKDGTIWRDGSQYLNAKVKANRAATIQKDLDEKEKQIAANKAQVDALNNKQSKANSYHGGEVGVERKLAEGLKKANHPNADTEAYNMIQAFEKGQIAPEELKGYGITEEELSMLRDTGRAEALQDVVKGRNTRTVIDPLGYLVKVKRKSAYEIGHNEDFRKMTKEEAQKELDTIKNKYSTGNKQTTINTTTSKATGTARERTNNLKAIVKDLFMKNGTITLKDHELFAKLGYNNIQIHKAIDYFISSPTQEAFRNKYFKKGK